MGIIDRAFDPIKQILKIKKIVAGLSIFIFIILVGLLGPLFYRTDPSTTFTPYLPPSREHPLGTDARGYDVLAQLMVGIRGSLYIGIMAALIGIVVAITLGSIAGYKGGIIDGLLNLITEAVMFIPSILLLTVFVVYFKVRSLLLVAFVIGITAWPWVAKAIRAQVMSLKQREFIYMSKIAGLSAFKILFQDILPNVASYIFMAFISLMGIAMGAEAGLSVIGLGTTEAATLGLLLYWSNLFGAIWRGLWWLFIPPGVTLIALTTSLLLINMGLDEFFNPRLRE